MSSSIETIRAVRPRAYEAWSPIDEFVIRAMVRAAAEIEDIADRVGRTEAEVLAYLERAVSDRPTG